MTIFFLVVISLRYSHIEMTQSILESINLGTKKILIAPGNHDLTRNPSRTELINNINLSPTPSDFLDCTLHGMSDLDILLSSFKKFDEFYLKLKDEHYPLEQIHSIVDSFLHFNPLTYLTKLLHKI